LEILTLIGIMDIIFALIVLVKPVRIVVLWMAIWSTITVFVQVFVGEPIWNFLGRFANWGAPLALLMILPRSQKLLEWFE